jgi:hypothetical protein
MRDDGGAGNPWDFKQDDYIIAGPASYKADFGEVGLHHCRRAAGGTMGRFSLGVVHEVRWGCFLNNRERAAS